jgi:hypothetical protein
MLIVIAILVLALIAAVVGLVRARERNASMQEAVTRLEDERDAAQSEKPQLGKLTVSIEELGSSFERHEQGEAQRQQLLADVDAKVAHGNERIDALVGRWSNPKQRSQLGEAWLIGALRRMGLRDGVHFEVQKRVKIVGARGVRDGVVDILLWLPNANGLALDSKFPWAGHLASVLDGQDEARDFALRKLRDALRNHIKDIARREYHRAEGVDIRHVLVVVPDWQTLELVKGVDPQIAEFAAEHRIGLFPADGLYEIAAVLGELHREEGLGREGPRALQPGRRRSHVCRLQGRPQSRRVCRQAPQQHRGCDRRPRSRFRTERARGPGRAQPGRPDRREGRRRCRG